MILIIVLIAMMLLSRYYVHYYVETFDVMDKYREIYGYVDKLDAIIGKRAMGKHNIRKFPDPNEIKRETGIKLIKGNLKGISLLMAKQLTKKKYFIFKIVKNNKIDYMWFKYKKNETANDISQLLQDNNVIVLSNKDCKTCLDYTNLGPDTGLGIGCNTMKSGNNKCKWNKKSNICETSMF